jgi:hypothetical protein
MPRAVTAVTIAATPVGIGYSRVVAITPKMLAVIEAQRAHFASDEHVRERAALWRDASAEECLLATREACDMAMRMLAMKSAPERELALRAEPIPADTLRILESLQRR